MAPLSPEAIRRIRGAISLANQLEALAPEELVWLARETDPQDVTYSAIVSEMMSRLDPRWAERTSAP